jgi:hypothetical protein
MRFWPFAKRDDLNTLHFSGDLDDIEVVEDVEKTFGIKISDAEAGKTFTIGELEALVRSKFKEDDQDDALWKLLCRIARDHSGHKGLIDRETTFFAEHAKTRKSNG